MLNIKHTLMVTTLSLGLVMGGVAVVSATTSGIHSNTSQTNPTPVAETHVTPAVAPKTHVTPTPVAKAHVAPVQHQQTHVAQPTENHNTNRGENHSESCGE